MNQLNRQPLSVNPNRSLRKEFSFNSNLGFKSKANPSVVTYGGTGRGMQGESVNGRLPAIFRNKPSK